jgi:hypothetical protein
MQRRGRARIVHGDVPVAAPACPVAARQDERAESPGMALEITNI